MRSSSVAPDSIPPRDPIQTTEADGLPAPRRYWASAAIWLAMAMAVLDASIANIALPTIAHEFGATPAASIWIVNAYQIALTMLILPVAALGEIFGYRRNLRDRPRTVRRRLGRLHLRGRTHVAGLRPLRAGTGRGPA